MSGWTFTGASLGDSVPPSVIAVDLRNPQVGANAGNSFGNTIAMTDWEMFVWEFVKDVDGKVFGIAHIPASAEVNAQKVVLRIAANATSGVTRMQVGVKNLADGVTLNPGSLTDLTAQDVTVPGTAYLRKDVTFTDATNTWAPGDVIIVEVYHAGAHANDTLNANTLLLGAWLELV